jgi:hypothetical protein
VSYDEVMQTAADRDGAPPSDWHDVELAYVTGKLTDAEYAAAVKRRQHDSIVKLAQVRRYVRTEHGRRETVRSYVTKRTVTPDEHGWIPPADWLKGQRIWVARGEAIWAANKWKEQARTFHALPEDAELRPAAVLQPGDHVLLEHKESVVKAVRRIPRGMQVTHYPSDAAADAAAVRTLLDPAAGVPVLTGPAEAEAVQDAEQAAAEPGVITPLPQGTPTARPVLYPDQRRMLETVHASAGIPEQAMNRIRDMQPLSYEQLGALADEVRHDAFQAVPARHRALLRIANQLKAAQAEIAAAGMDPGVAQMVSETAHRGQAVKTTAGDLATGDVIAWRDFGSAMGVGTVTGISTQRHGRLVEVTVLDSAGEVFTHLFSARTVIYRLPDLPPDKPVQPAPGVSAREYVTVENLRPGDVLEAMYRGDPGTVTEIKRSGFYSAAVKLQFANGVTRDADVGGGGALGIAGIRIHRGPASQGQPQDMTIPAETPVPVKPDQVQPGDMIQFTPSRSMGARVRGAGLVTGTVTSVDHVLGENGPQGIRASVLEQDLKDWRVTSYDFYQGTAGAYQEITRLMPAASNPLARFANEAVMRRDTIAASLYYTFGRMHNEMVDGIAQTALTGIQVGAGGVSAGMPITAAQEALEAVRGMTVEPLLIRVGYLRTSAAGWMVPGGIDGRSDLIAEAAASLAPLVSDMAEMAKQQALATIANVPGTAGDQAVIKAIEALQDNPPLPDQAVRALATAAQQMAASATGSRASPAALPRPGRGSIAQQIAPYRAALPADPSHLGKTYVTRAVFDPPTLESLQRGVVPALRTAQVWVADTAADGGPGPVVMAQNEIVRSAGALLQLEVERRSEAAQAAMEDQRVSLEATVVSLNAKAGKLWDRAYDAGSSARDEWAKRHGFSSFDSLVNQADLQERRGHPLPGHPLADANDAYNKAYEAVLGDVVTRRQAAQEKLEEIIAQQGAARRDAAISVLREVRGEPFGGVPLTYTAAPGGAADKKELIASLHWAEGAYPASWLTAAAQHAARSYQGYRIRAVPRGQYNDSARMIELSRDPGREAVTGSGVYGSTATHEMAHVMERSVPGITALEEAELWRRTSTGQAGSRRREVMRQIAPGEYAHADRFPEPYSGKEYSDSPARELFSTGVESLLAGGSYLDDAFEKWMLGVLALTGPGPAHPYTGAVETQARPAELGDRLAVAPQAPAAVTMVTAGGFKVRTESTAPVWDPRIKVSVRPAQVFLVTDPSGVNVPLDPWNPQHSPEIRTLAQLKQVLRREGEDFATLREVPAAPAAGDLAVEAPQPLGAGWIRKKLIGTVPLRQQMDQLAAQGGNPAAAARLFEQGKREHPEVFVQGIVVDPVLQDVFRPVLDQLSPRAIGLLGGGRLSVLPAPNQMLEGDVVGGEYHDDTGRIDFNPAAFSNPQYAGMHETGHALDHRMGWVSQDPRWNALLLRLQASGDVAVKSYLTAQGHGGDMERQVHETWAEFFAWYMMGNGGTSSQILHVSAAAAEQLSAYFAQFGLKGAAAKQFASEAALAAPAEDDLPVCVLVSGPDGQVRALSTEEIRAMMARG